MLYPLSYGGTRRFTTLSKLLVSWLLVLFLHGGGGGGNNREMQKERAGHSPGQSTGNLFSYRLDSGFLNRHIRVSLNTAGFTNDLFDDFVKAGEEIWLFIPTDHEATVFLYENDKLIKTQRYEAY